MKPKLLIALEAITLIFLSSCNNEPCGVDGKSMTKNENTYIGTIYLNSEGNSWKNLFGNLSYQCSTGGTFNLSSGSWVGRRDSYCGKAFLRESGNCGPDYYGSECVTIDSYSSHSVVNNVSFDVIIEKDMRCFDTIPLKPSNFDRSGDKIYVATDIKFQFWPITAPHPSSNTITVLDSIELGSRTWRNVIYSFQDSLYTWQFKPNAPVGFYFTLKDGIIGFDCKSGLRYFRN